MKCPNCNADNYNKERYCKKCTFPLYCWSGNLNLKEIRGIISVPRKSTPTKGTSTSSSIYSHASETTETYVHHYSVTEINDCESLLVVLHSRIQDIINCWNVDNPRNLEKEIKMYRASIDAIQLRYHQYIKADSQLSDVVDSYLTVLQSLSYKIKLRKTNENQKQNVWRLKLTELDANTQYLEQVVSYADVAIIEPLIMDCKFIIEQLKGQVSISGNLIKQADLSLISKARARLLVIDEQIKERQRREEANQRQQWKKSIEFIRDYIIPIAKELYQTLKK